MSSIIDVIRGLNSNQISYVVVGGVAVVLHGRLRTTFDLDVVIALDSQNIRKTLELFDNLGLKPRLPVNPADFADERIRQQWITDRRMMVFSFFDPVNPTTAVDIFATYPMDYGQMQSHSIEADFGGTPVRICSLDDLISMKQAANRPHDLTDSQDLELIRRAKANPR